MMNKRPRQQGFSLIEVMLAMVILIVLLTIVTQLTRSGVQSASYSGRWIELDREIGLVLGQMERDIQMRVTGRQVPVRYELAGGGGEDALWVLSKQQGYGGAGFGEADRQVALVVYRVGESGLERGVRGFSLDVLAGPDNVFTGGGLNFGQLGDGGAALEPEVFDLFSPSLVRMELRYLTLEGGVLVRRAEPPADAALLKGLEVHVVALHPRWGRILESSPGMRGEIGAWFTDEPVGGDLGSHWRELVEDLPVQSSIPGAQRDALQEVRIYKRTILHDPYGN